MNDLAYWDALPKIGYHIPDHLKINGGRHKAPQPTGGDRSDADRQTYLRRKAKAEATRIAIEKVIKEQKEARKIRAPKPVIELEKRPEPKAVVAVVGNLPGMHDEGASKRCAVYVEFPDGHTETHRSIERAAKAVGVTPGTLRSQTGKGIPVKGCAVKIVRANGSYTQSVKGNEPVRKSHNMRAIILYHGKIEIHCESMVEAAQKLGLNKDSVRRARSQGTKICGWGIREA